MSAGRRSANSFAAGLALAMAVSCTAPSATPEARCEALYGHLTDLSMAWAKEEIAREHDAEGVKKKLAAKLEGEQFDEAWKLVEENFAKLEEEKLEMMRTELDGLRPRFLESCPRRVREETEGKQTLTCLEQATTLEAARQCPGGKELLD